MLTQSSTLSEAVRFYLIYLRTRRNATGSTLVTYKSVLYELVSYFPDTCVALLTIKDLDRYADHLALRGYKAKTLRNKLTIVRSLFKYLYIKDITTLRAEQIELPKLEAEEATFLEEEEVQRLLAQCKSLRDKALVLVLVTSGVRVSELVNIKVADVYKRSVVVTNGKGRKPRVTYITPETEQEVKQYLRTRIDPTGYLFPNYNGGRISRQYVARLIRRYAVAAELQKHVTVHTLRHTFATTLLRRGASIETVQPLMGHASIRTTRIYLHFTNAELQAKYDKIMSVTRSE